ncbi:NAD(P)H-dependent oxidoreductase [Aerococcaceae bacterium DSM 111022]|nr:NAD(P)H-dependent oxidoreductase [Aerococcaceae bacterium DSM 111022]
MDKTLIIVAHPELGESSSQQFLIESGEFWTEADYLDLNSLYETEEFDLVRERERILSYDRLFFQFPLYWYQAPAILKRWLDDMFTMDANGQAFLKAIRFKELGLIVSVGIKEDHFQVGAREGRTISEMLVPYEMLANAMDWKYLPVFNIHQFEFMTEEEKMDIMMRYACYIETGNKTSEHKYQQYILAKLEAISEDDLPLEMEEQIVFDLFVSTFEEQLDEFDELINITKKW